MRNRFGMTAAAAVLAVVLSITVASASSPQANGADVAAAATPSTIAPIQQLSLGLGASGDGVARVGDQVGQVPGFCHLHS